jgi:N-acetylmuramoyl-L-alanine amidase
VCWRSSWWTAPAAATLPFAAGACLALAPTGGRSRGRTVFVDPGHGGPDPGVTARAVGRKPEQEPEMAPQ